MRRGLAAAGIFLAVLAIYARTVGYGLFSDDFNWLVGAQTFDAGALFDLSHRSHFFRPVAEVYFRVAFTVCGHSSECYHGLNIALHAGTSLVVAALAGSISRIRTVGVLAGGLFAVMPAPPEAVAWVAAVVELLGAAFYVLAIWLFRRAAVSANYWTYAAATLSFMACLMSHESGVTLLPVLALSMWLTPPVGSLDRPVGRTIRMFVPLVLLLAVYLIIEYVINSRNYLVIEGRYALGPHVLSNTVRSLASMAVTGHGTLWLFVVGGLMLGAALAAPPRIKLYALATLIMLAPVVGFRGGLSSRYLYLPAVGFAALTAETLWWARGRFGRWPRAGVPLWWVMTIVLTLRFATFAVKNVRVWQTASAPFSAYASRVHQLYPAPGHGATLEVPPPPDEIQPQYLASLLQWEYRDVTLKVVVRER